MNQNTRLVIAFVLSVGIMFGYYTFFAPNQPTQQVPTAQNSNQPVKPVVPSSGATQANSVFSTPGAAGTSPSVPQIEAKNIVIETPVAKMTLSTRGGVFTSYELSGFRRDVSDNSPHTDLLADLPGSQSMFLGLKGVPGLDNMAVFTLKSDQSNSNGEREIVLAWNNEVVSLEKIFTFGSTATPYGFKVAYKVANLTAAPLAVTPYVNSRLLQKPQPEKSGIMKFLSFEQPDIFGRLYFKDKSLTSNLDWKDFVGGESASGAIKWAGLSDRYFIFALVPDNQSQFVSIGFDRDGNFLTGTLANPEITLNPQTSATGQFTTYVGPKILSELAKLNVSLEKAVDYGWFSILAVPILWLMSFLHRFIPNWGLVIIVLTFIIKMILSPVNRKSMQSMKAMQQLQPKLAEIREKFTNDRDKQNQAMMNLFRTHKVNPVSGCLPMFMQMPIYIVLYKVLWNAIELYHAPFFGFYKDLSAPDPYFIAPVILGVFMFLQQKLTPSASVDPTQQKMMMFMPIMFTGLMLFLPVGLVVYIFINTAMSVIHQFMIKRDINFKEFITGKWQPNGA